MFIALHNSKKKKPPKCPLSDQWKTGALRAVECYLAKHLPTLHLLESLRTLGRPSPLTRRSLKGRGTSVTHHGGRAAKGESGGSSCFISPRPYC